MDRLQRAGLALVSMDLVMISVLMASHFYLEIGRDTNLLFALLIASLAVLALIPVAVFEKRKMPFRDIMKGRDCGSDDKQTMVSSRKRARRTYDFLLVAIWIVYLVSLLLKQLGRIDWPFPDFYPLYAVLTCFILIAIMRDDAVRRVKL